MKTLSRFEEYIINFILFFRFDVFLRWLIFTRKIQFIRDFFARYLKIIRLEIEYNRLNRTMKIFSRTQSLNQEKNLIKLKNIENRHNKLKFWWMIDIQKR